MFESSYDHTQNAPWYLLLFAFAALFFTVAWVTRAEPVVPAILVVAGLAATPAERPLIERIQGRKFPSVFQAWSPAQNIEDASPLHTVDGDFFLKVK